MPEHELPDDLSRLEEGLAARPRPAPSEDLKRRVMAAVRSELARGAAAPRRRLSTWEFAAAVAAAVLFWMNLSMVVASDTRMDLCGPPPNGTEAAVAALCRLLPDMPDREARRQVAMLRAGSRLVPAPNVEPSAVQWIENQGRAARAAGADRP